MHEFPSPDIWLAHRVSYGETDCMGVVYYAEYLHFFERARSEYIRQFGMSYAEAEKKGVILPVREVECRYRHPARYDELILIRAAVSEWGRASLLFVYEIWNEDKTEMLAQGRTKHAFVNEVGKPVPVPHWFRELMSENIKNSSVGRL